MIRHVTSTIEQVGRLRDAVSSKPKLHFLHIGKTGGTAVKDGLAGLERAGSHRLVLHSHSTIMKDVPPGERFFFVVRDPIERFTSAFYSRQRQGRPRNDSPWSSAEKEVFDRFGTPDELASSLESTEAEHAMSAVQHLESSLRWFGGIDELSGRSADVLIAMFQEQLDEDFGRLCKWLGMSATLPSDAVLSHRTPPGLDRSLSARSVANLRSWYESDYRLIEACKSLPTILDPSGRNGRVEDW